MKRAKKCISFIAALALCLTGVPMSGMSMEVQAADTVDSVVKLKPSEASTFNDTDGDGMGEFEGWGTSLCWWANRVGGSEKLTSEAARLFFSDEGLDMNIGRYNVGGGDHVGEVTIEEVPVNENAVFYDLETEGRTPTYSGSSMKINEITAMKDVTYTASDADFGITKGTKVGSFKAIGYINKLNDAVGSGDNLHYTVNAAEAGSYTVKIMLTLTGTNKRDVALRVGEGTELQKDYVVDAATINNSMIASGNNNMLFVVTIENVTLGAGENKINIAGQADWTLDFVKMAVIKSGEEGVLPETDEFLHEEHIIRSDSGVPGYAKDVTKIDTSKKSIEDYQAEFARVDEECGYAWNYNWAADENQMNILKAAAEASGEDFIAEAFSNSPPYFMTESGCSSGNADSSKDNLRADSVNAFAAYMADVIEHWNNEGVITFQSATPMNEPYTNYWGANSPKQEGCHFDQGESQSRIIVALNKELEKKNIDIILSASDETSIDTAITSWNNLSDEAKAVVDRIDTHTYSGSDRAGLKATAEAAGRNLWMSEVDGAYTGGTNSGEMSAALGLAQRMMTDVNGLGSSAWILWNAIDMHADSSEDGQSWVDKGSANDYLSMEALEAAWQSRTSKGYWGLAAADHDNEEIVLSMKYYGYGQFSRYIRPGYTIIGTNKGTTLAAYDPKGKKAVVVAMNTSDTDKTWKFDMSGFETMGDKITAIRTSGSMDDGEKWADVTDSDNIVADTANNYFTATMKANSITTYIIEDVNGIKEVSEDETPAVKQIPVTADQVTGGKVWENGTTNTPATVVDNDYNTFYDGVDDNNGNPGYVTIDLGEAKDIAAVGYAPRGGFASRCVGATIYGSVDGNIWTELYTIDAAPAQNVDTMVYYTDFNSRTIEAYRYIKVERDSECNFSEIKVYEPESAVVANLKAHYDMSHDGSSLTDISGKGNDATLYDTADTDFAVYGDEEVLQFNNKQYAVIPSGVVTDASSFTVQAVVSTPTQSDNWIWCFGDGIGQWGANNISDYIFVSPNSSQLASDKILGAIKVGSEAAGGEKRMPTPSTNLETGYNTITLVSDGTTLTMYLNGTAVSTLDHGYDTSSIIPDGDILGYIGQSLYSPDKKLIANVSDIKIWNTALTADQVAEAAPNAENKTDMLLADIQKALLNGNASVSEIETDIALPSSIDGYGLKWTIPENDAIAQNGQVTLPEEDVSVNVTVTYGDQEATFALTVPGENIEKILNAAVDELDIPNKDDVRGNITLPTEIESGVKIEWATSHPQIVDVNAQAEKIEGYGEVPAGVVTRPDADTEVTMTATLTYKETTITKDIKIQVKKAPKAIAEKDYTDYFFAYFAGEGYSDGEQIYFASSRDGMNWDDLNNNNPILTSTLGEKGVRDPFIIRSPEGDKFYLIATDLKINGGNGWEAAQNRGSQSLMVWESTDLVNWSEQRMVEVSADIEAGCTWAPEATYDPATGEYVVYWSSRTPKVDNKQRLYYAKTRDFYTFTTPQLYIEKDQSSIDTTMIEENGTYYRYTKNEGGETNELGAKTKTIFLEKSNNVLGAFEAIKSDSLNKYQWVEGPTIFKLNEDDATDSAKWCLLVDEFSAGGYYPLLASNLSTGEFVRPEAGTYKMPSRARHGTPIRITAEEYAAVVAAYGSPKEVNVATVEGKVPELPDKVTVGETQKTVEWNLDGVTFSGDLYSVVKVTGTVEGSIVPAIANVQIIPQNVEYMIDCANEGSQTWKNAAELNTGILNAGTADQAKTDDNTWGYVSTISESGDMAVYSGSSISDPYEGGYWARGGKNISYQVTLPAGEHTFMFGANGNWWNQGRNMKVYYSVNGSEEKELCDFIQTKNVKSYSTGTLTLPEDAVVTLTVKKSGNADPVLSWITVCGTPDEPDPIVYTELKAQIDAAKALNEADYTPASFAAVTTALNPAEALLNNASSQEEVDTAAKALADAINELVEAANFAALQEYYDANKDIQGSYTEESYTAYVNARNAAEEVLGNKNAAQADVDKALQDLKDAVEALEEIQKVDKTELQKLYDAYSVIEQGNYTEESYRTLQDALKVAKAALDNEQATESDVKVAYEKLAGAYSGLKEKEPVVEVNKDELQSKYDEYRVIEQGSYTEVSYKVLQEALENAKKVLDDKDASEEEVNEAYAELQKAYEGLEKEAVVVVNKDELQKLYDAYKDQKQGDYTDASYKAFTKALKEAKEVLENKDATQEEVTSAYSALYDAVKGLTKKDGNANSGTTPSGSTQTSNTTKTGDTAPVMALVVVALAAALTAIVMLVRKRRVNR